MSYHDPNMTPSQTRTAWIALILLALAILAISASGCVTYQPQPEPTPMPQTITPSMPMVAVVVEPGGHAGWSFPFEAPLTPAPRFAVESPDGTFRLYFYGNVALYSVPVLIQADWSPSWNGHAYWPVLPGPAHVVVPASWIREP